MEDINTVTMDYSQLTIKTEIEVESEQLLEQVQDSDGTFYNSYETHQIKREPPFVEDDIQSEVGTDQPTESDNQQSRLDKENQRILSDPNEMEYEQFKCNQCPKIEVESDQLVEQVQDSDGTFYNIYETQQIKREPQFVVDDIQSEVGTDQSTESDNRQSRIDKENQRILSDPNETEYKQFKCNQCPKSYTGRKTLTVHLRTHTGERPFKCDSCGKTYNDSQTLKRHRKFVHEGVKPFQCSHCSQYFARRQDFKRHKEARHGEGDGKETKRYFCDECPKSYVKRGGLEVHKRSHTGERPYRCNDCSKTFVDRIIFMRHQKYVHLGLKPFHCDKCPIKCSTRQLLLDHKLVHTNEKPFQCDFCEKTFKCAKSLHRHKKTIQHTSALIAHGEKKKLSNQQALITETNIANFDNY